MTTTATQPDPSFLLTSFTTEITDVSHTIVVSADGLLLASSHDLPRDRGDQLAAIAAGLTSLTQGAARLMEAGPVLQNIVEMEGGYLFLMSISDSGLLVTLARHGCDVGHVAYHMTLLVDKVGKLLRPATRTTTTTTDTR